jgi:hypothetical protein
MLRFARMAAMMDRNAATLSGGENCNGPQVPELVRPC